MANQITLNQMKDLLPFGAIIVSIVLAWGALNGQLNLTANKVDGLDKKLDKVETMQSSMGNDIARIKQAINDLTGKNTISRLPVTPSSYQPVLIATPGAQAWVVNNYIQPTPHPTEAPKTTPAPVVSATPTPQFILPLPISGILGSKRINL